MRRGKIKAKLMKMCEEMRQIAFVRPHCTEEPTDLVAAEPIPSGDALTGFGAGISFIPPAFEQCGQAVCWKRVQKPGKLGKKWSESMARPLPDLRGKKVRASEPEVLTPPPPEPVPPVEPEIQQVKSEPREAVAPKPAKTRQVPEKRSKAVSQVDSQKREAPVEKAPVIAQDPPKPLKVIRRRREQAPKVFETPPKTVPLAMLEGISLGTDEDANS